MRVKLIAHTKDAQHICAVAARTCYSNEDPIDLAVSMDRNKDVERIDDIMDRGHHSVIEHAYYTFAISGVSRSLTHQLVRHRIASYSQQSQRYVDLGEITYVMPPSIARDPEAMQIYQETMKIIWGAYRTLAELVPREDARYVLPNGCTTNIIVTMNARELLHFFSLRLCGRAQWEIRQLAHEMWMQADQVSPALFDGAGPGCVRGPCPEGKNTCGKPWEKKVKRNGKDASTTDKS